MSAKAARTPIGVPSGFEDPPVSREDCHPRANCRLGLINLCDIALLKIVKRVGQ